ncbi:hypothetical protein [Natronorubrum halophilum]|uniref:hypothetical protein n=1 Tax=Natronorubrum halophilum TaxID=1702106 RepID=UPI0010C16C00|nr:hypothetical protein [Natronorubrum halophilum]
MSANTQSPSYEETTVSKHCREQWSERSNRPQLNPRIAWLEAVPIDYPSIKPPARFARYHEVTGQILLACPDGTLATCIPLSNRSRSEQQYIRNQVADL